MVVGGVVVGVVGAAGGCAGISLGGVAGFAGGVAADAGGVEAAGVDGAAAAAPGGVALAVGGVTVLAGLVIAGPPAVAAALGVALGVAGCVFWTESSPPHALAVAIRPNNNALVFIFVRALISILQILFPATHTCRSVRQSCASASWSSTKQCNSPTLMKSHIGCESNHRKKSLR